MNTFLRFLLMQQASISLWTDPPIRILPHFQAYSKSLSQVNKPLYNCFNHITKSICLHPPCSNENYPETILMQLIERYPHIKRLSIGKKYEEFGSNEAAHLRAFIIYLKTNPKYPLSHVKHLIIHEAIDIEIAKSKELNRLLMEALSHLALKSISIHLLFQDSILTGLEIQPVLEKSIHLKKFKLKCFPDNHSSIELVFAKQLSLTSAHFLEFCGPLSTLESVKSCPQLRSLHLIKAHDTIGIKNLLLKTTSQSIRRIIAPEIKVDSGSDLNAITIAHPNIEHLYITLEHSTEMDLIKLEKT